MSSAGRSIVPLQVTLYALERRLSLDLDPVKHKTLRFKPLHPMIRPVHKVHGPFDERQGCLFQGRLELPAMLNWVIVLLTDGPCSVKALSTELHNRLLSH